MSGFERTGGTMRVQLVYQGLAQQADLVKQSHIERVSNVGWSTVGIKHQLAYSRTLTAGSLWRFLFGNGLAFFSSLIVPIFPTFPRGRSGLVSLLLIRLQSLQLRDNRFVDLAQHPLSMVLTEIFRLESSNGQSLCKVSTPRKYCR